LYRVCPAVSITHEILAVVYNHKDTIIIENIDMPLLLIIIMKKTKPKAHVHVFSYNYVNFSITFNVSTVVITVSISTAIPDLLLFPFESSSDPVRV